jgi:hypothetical protein
MIPPMKTLREIKATFRDSGLKGVSKKYGWKLFLAFFVYYLVRDVLIYVVLPYLVFQGIVAK